MVRDAVKKECWQGARRRVQLQLGQKQKEKAQQAAAVQACRAPTSCRARKKSMFHNCEKPQVSSVWKYQCISWLQHRDCFQRDIPTSHSIKTYFVGDFFFTFYGLLEQLRASRELKTISKQRKKPSKVPAAFYSLSASKVFQGKWRCAESSSHYWQWKPLRHFRYFIAFS